MLISFSVQNYKSFRDLATFSMAATKGTRHPEHLLIHKGNRLLKGSFIFGANASGKSNFVQAISFAKNLVVKGVENVDTNNSHFRLQKGYLETPGIFQFDFFVDETQYSYGFALSYFDQSIISEWLALVGPSNTNYVFSRNLGDNGSITIDSDLESLSPNEKKRFAVYKEDFQNKKNKNLRRTFMLTDVANRTTAESGFFKSFKEAFNWISKLTFIFSNTRYYGIGQFATDAKKKRAFEAALKFFDTGITGIATKSMKFDEMDENMKSIVNYVAKDNFYPRVVKLENKIIEIDKDKEGQIQIKQLVMKHGCETELFTSTDESDGTIRLFDLIPIFMLQEPRVFIIDEIGRSLHSKLLVTFIEKFYERTTDQAVQLIATTHDSNVLDLDLLRQDEIWFVERQAECNSRLYSLSEFKERFDKNVEREYLLGRYGAIPLFKEWEFE